MICRLKLRRVGSYIKFALMLAGSSLTAFTALAQSQEGHGPQFRKIDHRHRLSRRRRFYACRSQGNRLDQPGNWPGKSGSEARRHQG